MGVWTFQKADKPASNDLESRGIFDPFGGAKPRLLRRGKEASLRVNPEQAQAFRPGSRRVDFSRLRKKWLLAAQHLFLTILKLSSLQIQNSPSRLRH